MTDSSNPHAPELDALAQAEAIRSGRLTSEALVAACLARIDAREDAVRAWIHLDRDHALAQARAADRAHRDGEAQGPLHGVPVGIKDIFDTADQPTECGSPIYAGRRPTRDSTAVALLRQAGAVIMGKTVTTEFAFYSPGKTRNPHDPARTPGGSSSGSAAAVAAGMIPLAIGSQTGGSVIRPASFCGVVGYKPTHGLISRHGMSPLSRSLDHVGVFARSVEDAALLAETMMAFDEADPDTRPRSRPALLRTAREEPPAPPVLGFARTPAWPLAEADTVAAFDALRRALGPSAVTAKLPAVFDDAIERHSIVMDVEVAHNLAHEYRTAPLQLSEKMRQHIARGRRLTAQEYLDAVGIVPRLRAALGAVFQHCNAIVTPSAPGQAPRGLDSTGNPVFCVIWSLCGAPSVTLPLLQGAEGLPIGVQLIGAPGDDARLLRTARWLARRITALSPKAKTRRQSR
jgi:Asp-tRNA(Asn)/Glu-tRNA(Gln) amidotransferase A subunit family amidase